MATFGSSTTKAAVIEQFGPISRRGPSRLEMLKPYIDAVSPLIADPEQAGTLTLADEDKLSTERSRLKRAYLLALKESGLELPSNGLVVKRSGQNVAFWVDPDATPSKSGRPRAASANGASAEAKPARAKAGAAAGADIDF